MEPKIHTDHNGVSRYNIGISGNPPLESFNLKFGGRSARRPSLQFKENSGRNK